MTQDAIPPRGWSVENWRGFWSNPSAEVALRRIPGIVAPEVVATWPRSTRQVRGPVEYAQRVVDLLALVPDLRLTLAEQARDGEFVFIRWVARGTGPDGSFEGIGTDRIRLRDGLVVENLIMSDLAIFDALARRAGTSGPAGDLTRSAAAPAAAPNPPPAGRSRH
jgi:hypothetical protein